MTHDDVNVGPKRAIYETGLVRIGTFRCGRDQPAFKNSGPSDNYCFVFPRTAVTIHHDHEPPFVANPNVVTFYNHHDEYERAAISVEGDRSDWFALRHDVALDVARSLDPEAERCPERPFRHTHAMSASRVYALQRRLFSIVSRPHPVEPLGVEEAVIWLLESVLRSAHETHQQRGQSSTRKRIELANDAKMLLSRGFTKALTIGDLAHALDVSVFHLCRVFRLVTGGTLHEYRQQLRLRWSLERLGRHPRPTLVQCALEAGFSSHSHYGSAFKRAFGHTPSSVARMVAGQTPEPSCASGRISMLLAEIKASRRWQRTSRLADEEGGTARQ